MLVNAQEEAERASHNYIGTEHLLLGLLREPEGLGAKALAALGIEIEAVRAHIDAVVDRGTVAKIVPIVPTSKVKRTIEIAFEESMRMKSDSVGTEHLLLGLLAEGTSVAPHVLRDMGVDESRARAEIERLRPGSMVELPSLRVDRIFEVFSRVLVHDREPPHRLWEGRIVGHQGDRFQVRIEGHPDREDFLVEPELLHPIPIMASRGCEYCRAS